MVTEYSITELTDLVRAGLDADEALALEAPGRRWHIGNAVDPTQPCNVHTFPEAREVADGLNWLVAEHIARHNPERVLAEVAARRQLLDTALGWEHYEVDDPWYSCSAAPNAPREHREHGCTCGRDDRVHQVLTLLAKPYQTTETT